MHTFTSNKITLTLSRQALWEYLSSFFSFFSPSVQLDAISAMGGAELGEGKKYYTTSVVIHFISSNDPGF